MSDFRSDLFFVTMFPAKVKIRLDETEEAGKCRLLSGQGTECWINLFLDHPPCKWNSQTDVVTHATQMVHL